MHAPRKEKWQEKLKRSRYLIGAVVFHLILFFMLATLVIWPSPPAAPTAEFQPVAIKPPPPPPLPPPLPGDPGSSSPSDSQTVVPVVTPPRLITTQNAVFQMESSAIPHPTLSLNKLGIGPGIGPGGPGIGPAAKIMEQLSKLLFLLPDSGDIDSGTCGCPRVVDSHLIVHVPDGQVHTCYLQVRGVVEKAHYDGGTLIKDSLIKGGTPNTAGSNIYELSVDDPPQTYYLNAGSDNGNAFVINYSMHIDVKDGSKITLHADSVDGAEKRNRDKKSAPDDMPDHPIAVKQPYNGQFIQVDAVKILDE